MTRLSLLCLVILLVASRLYPATATRNKRSALDAADKLEQELRQYDEAMVEKKEMAEASDDTDSEEESSLSQRIWNNCRYGGCKGKGSKYRNGKKRDRLSGA